MNIEKISTPDEVGKGLWFSIHTLAADVNDEPYKWKFFEYYMKLMQRKMKCSNCKGHFGNYLSSHPFDKYYKIKNGAYIYTHEFHNAVNKRLGKNIVDLDESFQIYSANDLTKDQSEKCGTCNYHIDETSIPDAFHVYSAINDSQNNKKKHEPIIIRRK